MTASTDTATPPTPMASTPDSHSHFDDVFREVLSDVLNEGHRTTMGSGLSIGSGRSTCELMNRGFQVQNGRDRLLYNSERRFNLPAAVGRFAWMMSGSDRLHDIEHYDANASRFTDDGLTVPGSCDGARILYPRRGANQLLEIVRILREDPTSRRASVAVYQPEDAGRRSRDIPCILSASYLIRDGRLHATTVLRSSNAARVLPYDLFLYSLFAEVVAAEVGVELGSYHQFAVSLHVYDEDRAMAQTLIASSVPKDRPLMAPMPRGTALADLGALLRVEQFVRARHLSAGRDWVTEALQRLDGELPPYWQDFALLLLLHGLRRSSHPADVRRGVEADVAPRLSPPFLALSGLAA